MPGQRLRFRSGPHAPLWIPTDLSCLLPDFDARVQRLVTPHFSREIKHVVIRRRCYIVRPSDVVFLIDKIEPIGSVGLGAVLFHEVLPFAGDRARAPRRGADALGSQGSLWQRCDGNQVRNLLSWPKRQPPRLDLPAHAQLSQTMSETGPAWTGLSCRSATRTAAEQSQVMVAHSV